MHLFRKKPPYTKRVAITPPAPSPDRSGVAIVTQLKNEETYISEWLRFHLAVGIKHFFIYDNGSTDRTLPIVNDLLGPEQVTVMPWIFGLTDVREGHILNSQVLAFSHAILNFGSRYRWMAFIDTDEFLLPKTGRTIEEALVGVDGFPNISLPWHMFGTSGHKTRPEGPITHNYTMRHVDPMSREKNASNFKCIVDPCEVSEVSVHHFRTVSHGDITCNDSGARFTLRDRKKPEFYSSKFIQLNHYYTKSEEELHLKLARGPASPASRERYNKRVLSAVRNIMSNEVEDSEMLRFIQDNQIELS